MNHPYLVIYSATASTYKRESAIIPDQDRSVAVSTDGSGMGLGSDASPLDPACGLCRDPAENPVEASCGHVFCRACAMALLEAAVPGVSCVCPACNRPLSINLFDSQEPRTRTVSTARNPSKRFGAARGSSGILQRIGKLESFRSSTKIEALREELHLMMSEDPSAKAIVFSQFTSMLDLVGFRLEQTGIKTVRLHGKQRILCFLITIKIV